jgi:D-lactate dehydrogenase
LAVENGEKVNKATALKDLLKGIDAFSSIDDPALALMQEKMSMAEYKDGEYLCREGDEADRMFIIASGEVEVLKRGEKEIDVMVTTLKPGEVAGIMSLFEYDVRSASMRARGRVETWMLDKETFSLILEKESGLARKLLAYLSRRLRAETYTVAKLLSGDMDSRLKVAVFDTKPYTRRSFEENNDGRFSLHFFEPRLGPDTLMLASGFEVVCAFVNDDLKKEVIGELKDRGVKMIAMRCAGYNNVDAEAAFQSGVSVARVPAYSPHSIAEHAAALMLTLNRNVHRAYNRVREGNFSLSGLEGFDFHGKTAGIIGLGRIGKCLAEILHGFGMTVLAFDEHKDLEFAAAIGLSYVTLEEIFAKSDVLSLHAPLLPSTFHMVNAKAIATMKTGVMIVNTGRGALIDTAALIEGLKSGKIGAAGLDVYEEEEAFFFEDMSNRIISDDTLARLMTFNNVIITGHQAFLTREALSNIAKVTLDNIAEYAGGKRFGDLSNAVMPAKKT